MERRNLSNVNCSVYGCHSKSGRDKCLNFHSFPKQNAKVVSIINKMGTIEKIDKKLAWERILLRVMSATAHLRVCSLHFKKEDFILPDVHHIRARLKTDAVPSCNLPKRKADARCMEKTTTSQRTTWYLKRQLKRQLQIEPIAEDHVVVEEATTNKKSRMLTPAEQIAVDSLISLATFKKEFAEIAVQVQSGDIISSFIKLIDTPAKLNSLTGLNSFEMLNLIVQQVVKHFSDKEMHKLTTKERIIMSLMKLKLGIRYVVLATLFGTVSSKTCSIICKNTIKKVARILQLVIVWPSSEECLNNIPTYFADFQKVRVVLDCTEIVVQKPKCLCCRVKTYSHYKGNNTLKFMTGGLITFISKAYGGRCSDKVLFEKSCLFEKLEPGDSIVVDRVFLIDNLCKLKHINIIRPPFLRNKSQFSKDEAIQTAKIARARVNIERSNQRIKIFEIFSKPLPWTLVPLVEDIFILACGIVNLSASIIGEDKFVN